MDAVRLHGVRDLRFEAVADPEAPGPDAVRIKIEAAGICGSDLHNFATGQWISRAPSVAGHEFCGIVESVGADVSGLTPGDAVVADSRYWCGTCAECRAGHYHCCATLGFVGEACDGGFAEAVILPARLVHKRPADVPVPIAAMAEPLAVALHAVARISPTKGAPVLVVGCGTIGGLIALVLAHNHEGPVLVGDRNGARAELVASVTGARVVTLDGEAISQALAGETLRCAIDATGAIPAIEAAMGVLGPRSRLGLVGISHGALVLDPNSLVEREIGLMGCHAFADELPQAIGMLGALAGQLEALIDAEIGLADVPAAYERLLAGETKGLKTIIRI
ncbi:zinc-dependent alcohol dehydrogenase [Pelagibacterium montanilacus]|uniref:zinc-dependent alcohol dehydrogenase n=1 Tax=Pelagibacterium montanilacus TaxID=2185280 RepID=UPI000F8DF46E|nr:alcohol dehydrogenase catalytic domain-containing protein [Pelagibacterium montanilacus]